MISARKKKANHNQKAYREPRTQLQNQTETINI